MESTAVITQQFQASSLLIFTFNYRYYGNLFIPSTNLLVLTKLWALSLINSYVCFVRENSEVYTRRLCKGIAV